MPVFTNSRLEMSENYLHPGRMVSL